VGDGRTEGRLTARAFDVHVNPLTVTGGLGEAVDPVLGQFQPVADHDFLADPVAQLARAGELELGHASLLQEWAALYGPARTVPSG
jgi:hypothetical protein